MNIKKELITIGKGLLGLAVAGCAIAAGVGVLMSPAWPVLLIVFCLGISWLLGASIEEP